MFILLFSISLLFIQIFLIVTTNLNIFPEFFFYPWLISKGHLLYRDVAVQHGFLSYLLLVPFSLDKSLFTLKIFYLVIQSFNLLLVLLILRKTTSKLGIIIGGIFFTVLNFYLSENKLWDEIYVTPFFLSVFYLLTLEKIKLYTKLIVTGFLIGFTSFMKPGYGIMIIPVILIYRSLSTLIPIMLLWAFTLIFFFVNNGLTDFLNNYFFLNKFYVTIPKVFWLNRDFFNFTGIVFILSLTFFLIFKNLRNNKNLTFTLLFTLSAIVLFYPAYNKTSFLPFSAFFSIFAAQLVGKIKKPFIYLYLTLLIFYGMFIFRQAKHQYAFLDTYRTPYMANKAIAKTVNDLKQYNFTDKNLYVFGNKIEIYYLLDKPTQVYFPLIFPFVKAYFETLENQIIQDLKSNNVEIIIMPKPIDKNYLSLNKLKKYILTNYRLIKKTKNFDLYIH